MELRAQQEKLKKGLENIYQPPHQEPKEYTKGSLQWNNPPHKLSLPKWIGGVNEGLFQPTRRETLIFKNNSISFLPDCLEKA